MPTLAQLVRTNARRAPDRDALVFAGERTSWAELDRRVDRLAAGLGAAGVGHGDRVAVAAPNGPGFVEVFFAVARLGAVVVPVNVRSAAPEVHHVLDDAGAAALVFDPSLAGLVGEVERRFDLAGVALVPIDAVEGRRSLRELAASAPPLAVGDDAVAESDDALLMYTSGTTGRPKGVLLDHHRALWAALSEIASLGLRDGDRYLHLSPFHHSGGIVFLVCTTLLSGTHVLVPAFEPRSTLDAVERERCAFLLGVPTMFELLLRDPTFRERDLSSWRLAVFGAAPMPRATLDRMIRDLPDVELVQLCGQTEAGPVGIYSTAEQVRRRPDVTGYQAMAFYDHDVLDEEGRPVADGVGELVLRGPGVMKGYWRDPDATARTLRGGWLHTGDLVRRDPDGAMTIVDRLKDMVITGGRNVYSIEVERAVASHPGVAEVAVVGRPHDVFGETIVAVVVPHAGGAAPTLDDLRAHCADEIADYKLPRAVVVVEALPRNMAGKVLKRALRDAVVGATD